MVAERKLKFLHSIARHTNLENPYNEFVSANTFPEQDPEMLGSLVFLKYRDMYHAAEVNFDDEEDETENEDDIDIRNLEEGYFTVLRFDITEPYRFIGLSLDGNVIVVSSTKDDKYRRQITHYPIQYEEFNGLDLTDKYKQNPAAEIKGVSIRVDNGEPCYSVICEFLPNHVIRFVLGDEVKSIVNEVYDPTIYDGLDASDYSLDYINIDGKRPQNEGQLIYLDVNGRSPDLVQYLYKYESLSREETAELRLTLLEENTIYGTN